MKWKGFLLNKYTLSVFILLGCLGIDVYLHKGMSRVIIPESFTDKRIPQDFAKCNSPVAVSDKKWTKAINSLQRIEDLNSNTAGFEMDVYFDMAKNLFFVYHDSSAISLVSIESILEVYKKRNLSSSIWLDFKNLSSSNAGQSLNYVISIRQRYNLDSKIIIESSSPQYLKSFCDSGFYTSYYTPFFNPYLITEKEIIAHLDSISSNLLKYKVSALSGYYFQYPFLKRFFPKYPILTWTDKSNISLMSNIFNRSLVNDDAIKVVLFP